MCQSHVHMTLCIWSCNVFNTSLSPPGNRGKGDGPWEETGRTDSREQTNRPRSQTTHPESLCWGGWICFNASQNSLCSFFLKLVCFVCMFGPEICCFVVWPEPAACPWAEAAAWGGDDGRQLCHPHQPVLSPRQCGGGAQPEEGNVSGAGYTHSDALQTHKHEAALRPDH